jgi:hypothetical protein
MIVIFSYLKIFWVQYNYKYKTDIRRHFMKKAIIGSVFTILGFYTLCIMLRPFALILFKSGDAFNTSFHIYTYIGITLLAGLIVGCTILIIERINNLKKLLELGSE